MFISRLDGVFLSCSSVVKSFTNSTAVSDSSCLNKRRILLCIMDVVHHEASNLMNMKTNSTFRPSFFSRSEADEAKNFTLGQEKK